MIVISITTVYIQFPRKEERWSDSIYEEEKHTRGCGNVIKGRANCGL